MIQMKKNKRQKELNDTRFFSNILRDSVITMEGIKMMDSPSSHFSKISKDFELILGLFVNHQSSACVSATKSIMIIVLLCCKGIF